MTATFENYLDYATYWNIYHYIQLLQSSTKHRHTSNSVHLFVTGAVWYKAVIMVVNRDMCKENVYG